MGVLLARWSTLMFCVLLMIMILVSQHAESRKIIPSFEHDDHTASSISDYDRETLQSSWVFDIDDMKSGKRKAIHFPRKEDSINSLFIRREKADSIPFSREELPRILEFFGYTPGSPEAKVVGSALEVCEQPASDEVFKACFTSFESMLDTMFRVFKISNLSRHQYDEYPTLLSSVFHGPHKMAFQNYTVLEAPREVATLEMAGCHAVAYPYAVFFCHVLPGKSKVFKIPLVGDDGVRVEAVTACHLETSKWDPENFAFLALGSKPGDPICHFFQPYDNFVWVHTSSPLTKDEE